jgi:hypothetical protein
MENFGAGLKAPGLTAAVSLQWLVDCTRAARVTLGPNGLLTHAPQAPYFGKVGSEVPNPWTLTGGGYSALYVACGADISWFNVQFYNQGLSCYTTFASLFLQSNGIGECAVFPGTSVSEIASYGIPLAKIVVGKYMLVADASNGFVAASTLGTYFSQAASSLGWQAGVMVWAWQQNRGAAWLAQAWPTTQTPTQLPVPTATAGPTSPVSMPSTPSLPPQPSTCPIGCCVCPMPTQATPTPAAPPEEPATPTPTLSPTPLAPAQCAQGQIVFTCRSCRLVATLCGTSMPLSVLTSYYLHLH